MNFEEDDNSYRPSPHIVKLLESGIEDAATVRAFLADIFAQRIRSHHASAMEGPRFSEHLDRFVERAPRIIEVIVLKDGAANFSIRYVQQVTDDLVCLDDMEFVRRYGLEEMLEALMDAEAAAAPRPKSRYVALAHHLHPNDPNAGACEVDQLILAGKRARCSAENRQRTARIIGPIAISIGLASLTMLPLLRVLDPHTPWPLPSLPPAAAFATIALGVTLTWFGCRWLDGNVEPPLPEAVAQWLKANGCQHGLRHWDELYWPTEKRLACKREILGYIFWKKAPPSASHWPQLPNRTDAEWDYWEQGAGRSVSELYRRRFVMRIEQWSNIAYRLHWLALALVTVGLIAVAILSFLVPALVERYWLRIGLVAAFIGLSISLAYGLHLPLRWMPRSFRRRWFGPLSPEAEAYRDFLLARTRSW